MARANRLSAQEAALFPRLCLAAGIVCIGFSAIFVRLAAVPGVVSAFYRVFIASVVLVPWWLIGDTEFPDRRTLLLSVLAGIFFGLDLAFWNVSVFLTTAATSTVLAYLAPVWVGLCALLFFKEKFKKYFWPGAFLALGGMLLILGWEKIRTFEFGRGNILAVIASFFYAGYLLMAQVVRKKSGTLAFTSVSILASTVTLLLICLFRGEQLTVISSQSWLALLGMGLISHLAGWLSINHALGHIKASVASISLLGQPVITALAAIPILRETPGFHQVAGGLLILMGIYLVNKV